MSPMISLQVSRLIKNTWPYEVLTCPRCGENHGTLEFKTFKGGTLLSFTHWVACPTNGEPLLMRIEPGRKREVADEGKRD